MRAGARDFAGRRPARIAVHTATGVSGVVAEQFRPQVGGSREIPQHGGKGSATSLRGAVPARAWRLTVVFICRRNWLRRSPQELEEFRALPFTEVCFRVVKPFATPDVPEDVLWQTVSEAINFPFEAGFAVAGGCTFWNFFMADAGIQGILARASWRG